MIQNEPQLRQLIEQIKDQIWQNDEWFKSIQVFPLKDEGGHQGNNCICKPKIEIEEGVFTVVYHNLIIH